MTDRHLVANAFDVVIVPDFLCAEAATFEGRTLLFLASWLANGGQARNFPLHLACIGKPPPSVCCLAHKASASITVHQPLGAELWGCANKLRGLEVSGKEDRVLLLDADVMVVSDFSDLATLGRCIAAAPANALQISEPYWQKIYMALGMEPPAERIACASEELANNFLLRSMWPYIIPACFSCPGIVPCDRFGRNTFGVFRLYSMSAARSGKLSLTRTNRVLRRP